MKSVVWFISVLVFLSCKEDSTLPNDKTIEEEAFERSEIETILDTIYLDQGQSYIDSKSLQFDTTFLIEGVEYTLHLSQKLHENDTVYYDEKPIKKGNTIRVHRYSGRDIIYQFHLTDSKNNTVWKRQFTKKDYMKELGSIVAQSNMHLPELKTYFSHTKQLVLTQSFWVPDSDVGVQGILFFDLDGNSEFKYHCWYGSSGGECDVSYSPDSSFLLTCSEIIASNGKKTDVTRNDAFLAGSMIIGDRHVFASYAFGSDTSALGGRLYNGEGKLIKEFEFDGYGGALGYMLPRKYLTEFGRYYFVDEQNKFLLMIPESDPTKFKKYPFEELQYHPSELELDTILVLEKEVFDHRFGIDSLGAVRTYQVGDYTGVWKFTHDQ
ncbi:MAG: hypothetical protein AB8B56_19605 [Crocinitomicaceae bacterium]